MSQNNLKEALRWFRQAEKDLESAYNSIKNSSYDWACFQSQQAAEKSLKAYLYSKGRRKIITHSILELVLEASKYDNSFKDLKMDSKHLDGVYISSRYPNGVTEDLAPYEYYEEEDASICTKYAESILEKVRKSIER